MAKKKQAKKTSAKKPASKPATRPVARAGAKSSPKRSSSAARSKKPTPRRSKRSAPKSTIAAKAASKKATAKKALPKKAVPKKAASKKAASKKAAPTRVAAKRASSAKNGSPIQRRDRAGHMDPTYAADLRAKSKEGHEPSEEDAFIRHNRAADDLAEELGEGAVGAMTSGEDETEESFNREVTEERGGPFVPSTAGQEFAEGTDPSNPAGATREPFPRS